MFRNIDIREFEWCFTIAMKENIDLILLNIDKYIDAALEKKRNFIFVMQQEFETSVSCKF